MAINTHPLQDDFETRLSRTFESLLKEASRFYMAEGDVYNTLRKLAVRLEEAGISYAVLGAMAMACYGSIRMTQDIDILLTPEGLEMFRRRLVGNGYIIAFEGARKTFRDSETRVRIDVITTGEYPGDGKPKPVRFPDPADAFVKREGLRVLTLENLVELKLASGQSAPDRLRDLADVQDMIRKLRLPADFAERLDRSVGQTYRQLWETVARGEENPTERMD